MLGNSSAETFKSLWLILLAWGYFVLGANFGYVTDRYLAYPCFIEDADFV
jgi:hypothetical protein